MSRRLRGKRVAVFGLARSGLSAAKLLVREGARVTCLDDRDPAQLGAGPLALLNSLGLWANVHRPSAERLCAQELVVVSPGVPLARADVQAAMDRGVEVMGEVELAAGFLGLGPGMGPKVGITGTNGKSTTTALTGELFRQAGMRPFVGGNLGEPLSEAALSPEAFGAYVVELSSFQLEGTRTLHLEGAALLNVTPDHLDRYPDLGTYAQAKARIFRHQGPSDLAVVNADDPRVLGLLQDVPARKWGFSRAGVPRVSRPELLGCAVPTEGGFELPTGERFQLRNRALRGGHNLENAMAAALLARGLGVAGGDIQRGLDSYPGLPHRLESVALRRGVEWVNDSKATNVDSTLVALAAFSRGVWLILGGRGKGAPYTPVVDAARGRVHGVLTVGEDAPAIEAAFGNAVEVHPCGTLAQAVAQAAKRAQPEDTVLLSPACASYDQFKNFEDRGETFKRLVKELGE